MVPPETNGKALGNRRELRLALIAGEHSGDALGGKLMEALDRATGGRVRYAGVGSEHMAARGLGSIFGSFAPSSSRLCMSLFFFNSASSIWSEILFFSRNSTSAALAPEETLSSFDFSFS